MEQHKYALGKANFILMAIAVVIIIVGFLLMGGEGSTAEAFNPEIFSVRRIKIAPIVCVVGFIMMGVAIMYRGKHNAVAATTPRETAE
ncbi:MAG: DUF3098 domain-containing protein [Bacteroidales bacterium]|nr:DUF3098 domain-containing protein [Bacteroidales bacterium]